MLLNVAICDDELSELKNIEEHLTAFSMQSGIEFNVSRFTSAQQLLSSYGGMPSKYDVVFLDVEMPEMNGIEAAEKIREIPDRNVIIIFITSYPEYMQESFDVQAYQYLTKPLSYVLFEEKLKRLVSYMNELQTNIAVVSQKSGQLILHLDDIICFETLKSISTKSDLMVTTVNDQFPIKGKIAEMEKRLRDCYFVGVHRSVLVNMKYIKRFTSNTVELTNGKTVEASRRRMAEVKDAFSKYMIVRYKK